jgi:hypothetical protein
MEFCFLILVHILINTPSDMTIFTLIFDIFGIEYQLSFYKF